jgi:folylpolyglutamate synthase/dihydropteroate synthase
MSSGAVREGVLRARAPGRFQVEMEGERRWIFDVAHNPHAADALAKTLDEIPSDGPRVGVGWVRSRRSR